MEPMPEKDAHQNARKIKKNFLLIFLCALMSDKSEQHWPRESAPRCRKARAATQRPARIAPPTYYGDLLLGVTSYCGKI